MQCERDYKTQLLKVNLFDEYIQLRAKELVEQYEFLFEHDGTFLLYTRMNIITLIRY